MPEYNIGQREKNLKKQAEKSSVSLSGGTEHNGMTEQREAMFECFLFLGSKSLIDTNYNIVLSKLIHQHLN